MNSLMRSLILTLDNMRRGGQNTGLVASNGELDVQYSAHSSVAPFACDMMAPTGCLGISRSVRFE